ncbi:conjugative transfer protein [Salmonella enterica subsp. enterica]|uniref:Conjugative transfer protein n=1 Tax=Salmonella enterica I TaxID=59201 RepID=A0A379X3I9_SALET|nr:conjugative transfer protein [Salmonella enterica subsp. enterica]
MAEGLLHLIIRWANCEQKRQTFTDCYRGLAFYGKGRRAAANTWTEARNDAMGGTGVASANYGSGVLLNPALLAKAKPEDNITVVLPAVGVQITDKDNLQDEIDDISDKVDYYDEVVDNLTLGQILLNPRGVLNQFQGAALDLADELEYLNGKTARANAGAGWR